ncbi:hypothetical protein KJ758_00180 [Patescibacteria group bacterium]|nr:hypothetical protein [Patescibacteria group bacterium]
MKNPRGYTWQDALIAASLVLALMLLIVVLTNPGIRLGHANDSKRTEDIRDLTEIILELQLIQPEAFANIVGTAAAGRIMIGSGNSCAGSFGSLCPDEVLRDSCFDLTEFSDEKIPVDPLDIYSGLQTGYYLLFENNVLEIGACNPETQAEVVLRQNF